MSKVKTSVAVCLAKALLSHLQMQKQENSPQIKERLDI
jgi:hypothetical protein